VSVGEVRLASPGLNRYGRTADCRFDLPVLFGKSLPL